jgi:hypothetical protein
LRFEVCTWNGLPPCSVPLPLPVINPDHSHWFYKISLAEK